MVRDADGFEEPEHMRKIFIGGLSSDTNDDSLRSYFGKYGEIVDCIVMRDNLTKRSRGFGFVTYSNATAVDDVQSERPHILDGKTVDTKRVVPKSDNNSDRQSVKKVFVGGLKDQITDQDLKTFFSQFGPVEKVETFTDKETGKKKGFAFVTFEDFDSVDKCYLHATSTPDRRINIQGVKVEVKKARSPQEMKGSGGPMGGGGGRGGRMGGGGRGGFNGMGGGGGYNQGGGGGGYQGGYAGNSYNQGGYGGNQGGYNQGSGGGGYSQGGSYGNQGGGGGYSQQSSYGGSGDNGYGSQSYSGGQPQGYGSGGQYGADSNGSSYGSGYSQGVQQAAVTTPAASSGTNLQTNTGNQWGSQGGWGGSSAGGYQGYSDQSSQGAGGPMRGGSSYGNQARLQSAPYGGGGYRK